MRTLSLVILLCVIICSLWSCQAEEANPAQPNPNLEKAKDSINAAMRDKLKANGKGKPPLPNKKDIFKSFREKMGKLSFFKGMPGFGDKMRKGAKKEDL